MTAKFVSYFDRFFFVEQKEPFFSIVRALFFFLVFLYWFYVDDIDWHLRVDFREQAWDPVGLFQIAEPNFLLSLFFQKCVKMIFPIAVVFCIIGLFRPLNYMLTFFCLYFIAGFEQNLGSHPHHLILMVGISMIFIMTRYSGVWSIDQLVFKKKQSPKQSFEYNWPVRLIQVYMVSCYFIAACQKLKHSGLSWFRFETLKAVLESTPHLTPIGEHLLTAPELGLFLISLSFFVQLIAPLALVAKFRVLILGPFLFHVATRLILGTDGGFLGWMICYVFWIPAPFLNQLLKKHTT